VGELNERRSLRTSATPLTQGLEGCSTQCNVGWQPVPWAVKLPAERKTQSADTKETKRRRKLLLSKIMR
jgi:hypothetical protein